MLDVGNTHTHLGLANDRRVAWRGGLPTVAWRSGAAVIELKRFVGARRIEGAAWCSVVPAVNARLARRVAGLFRVRPLEVNHHTVRGIGIRYPRPETIGADRLANAVAVRASVGAPAVAVDFGTAVTFDVVDGAGDYVGGIIAPGLSAMTDYLHEKTALLPRVTVREPRRVIGRNTEEAMRVGAVRGYRCLVNGLLGELRRELGVRRLPVVVTGGCARLVARGLEGIRAVAPDLTLDGLRRVWLAHREEGAFA